MLSHEFKIYLIMIQRNMGQKSGIGNFSIFFYGFLDVVVVFLLFLGLLLRHMEVPRLGV